MDGIAFTLHIRRHKKSPNIFLPIIMMTGLSERRQVIERPRRFVRVGEYFGPDRRRRDKVFTGNEKRGSGEPAGDNKSALGQKMKQDEINKLFNPDEDPSKD
ncbi:MAG: hypothetical protein EXQ86_00550 [Rhodospirillales bacterium]|nr:hypothetical protein [Rhodospirillales bacterium]